MAVENDQSRKEARKLAEKEAKKKRKKAKRKYKRELKKEKQEVKEFIKRQKIEERDLKNKSKRKYHLKIRFVIVIVLIVAALGAGGFFAAKTLLPLAGINFGNSGVHDPDSSNTVINENEVFDAADFADITTPLNDVLSGLQKGDEPVSVLNSQSLSLEYRICAAVISDWHISPLTQTRAVIEDTFGDLYRYEDWNEGVYYHRGFPETMYITYNGAEKGEQPNSKSICDSVSICLKYIIEFDEFTPDSSLWGKVNKTNSEDGWTKYFYSIIIKSGVNLIVYCDKDGKVDKETHIIVRKV